LNNQLNVSGNSSFYSNVEVDKNLTLFGNSFLYGKNNIYSDISFNSGTAYFNTNLVGYNSITYKNRSTTEKNASINLGIISNTSTDAINYNGFLYGNHKFDGSMVIGKGDTDIPTTFDLSANYGNYGIKYNGPVTIGKNASDIFNLNATSGTINYSGNINVYNQLRIKPGGLFVIEASLNSLTLLETQTEVTNQFNVSNNGTGPALIANQIDTYNYDIVNFQDNNVNVFTIGYNGDTQTTGRMRIGYPITTSSPFDSFDSIGDLYKLNVNGDTNIKGDLIITGDITSYSDINIKRNIKSLSNCLDSISKLGGYRYNRIDLDDKINIGLIAQEVEVIYPELISETNNIKGINYQSFIAIIIEGIKELKNQNIELLKRIEQLEK
jgi:hypothetical protein